MRRVTLLLLAAGALACSKPRPPIEDCVPTHDARPICIFHNPEDFAQLANTHRLVVSQMGRMDGSAGGSLAFFDLERDESWPAYPIAGREDGPRKDGWGDASCPGPPGAALSPHGLDLGRTADRSRALLVVNHGGRESIEMFELANELEVPELTWRGCVLAPDDSLFNDVAALPDGGFVVTRMLAKGHETRDSLLALLRLSTGFVYEWQPGTGLRRVPGTDGPMPNGVTASRDGETLFVDMYMADEVRKISRKTGERLGTAQVASPDNVNWSPDGQLLVASHDAPLNEILACGDVTRGQCPFHFQIVRLDPETLKGVPLYQNAGPPMGAGTSALRIGDELVIGTFAGDRLLRVTLPEWATKSVAGP